MIRHLAVAGVILVAASCGSGGDDEATSIEFAVFGEPEEVQAYRDVIAAFDEEQDDVDVSLVVAADRSDLLTRVSTAIAGGSPPDVFLVNYRFYGQFAASGALEPVEDRLEDSGAFAPEDFYPVAMDAFRWDDEQLCMPQNVSSLAVYYNRELFEAAGLAEPPDGWTWDDMVAAASALTVDTDADGTVDQHGLGVEPGIIRLAPFVWSGGGEVFDDDTAPTGYALDTAADLVAVQDFLDVAGVDRVVPSDEEMESEDLESRFLNGRLAMFMSSRRVVPVFRSIDAFSWDVAPIPIHEEPANVLHSDAYCITSDSEHHDAAWRFIEFALGEEGQRIATATGRTVPSMIEAAESDDFLASDEPPSRSRVFLDAVPHLRPLPTISTWPEIEDISDALIEEAMFEPGGGEALELVTALKEETADAFARANR